MKIRPVNDRLLVRPFKAPEKSAGGLFIPDQAQGEVQVGIVQAAGPGKGFEGPGRTVHHTYVKKDRLDDGGQPPDEQAGMYMVQTNERAPLQAQPGDIVAFGKYSGAKVEVGTVELFLLREDELLAVIEDLEQAWLDNNAGVIRQAHEGVIEPTELQGITKTEDEEADKVVGLDGLPLPQGDGDGGEPPAIRRIVEP